jgi:hypothetical protein
MGYGIGDDLEPGEGLASATGKACEATRAIIGKTAGAAITGLVDGGSHLDTGSTEKRQEGPVEPRIREVLPRDTPATDLEVARVAIGACVGDLLLGRSPNTRRVIGLVTLRDALRSVADGLAGATAAGSPTAVMPPDGLTYADLDELIEVAESRQNRAPGPDKLKWVQVRIAELADGYRAIYPDDDGSALRYALEGAADRDRRTRGQARRAARQASQGK